VHFFPTHFLDSVCDCSESVAVQHVFIYWLFILNPFRVVMQLFVVVLCVLIVVFIVI